MKSRQIEDHQLDSFISKVLNQTNVPFGDALLQVNDICFGIESCEELWTPNSPHIAMGLDGVDVFTNASASHHQFRKLHSRLDLIKSACTKSGGVYMYSNQHGCDGERVYYDGSSSIFLNGNLFVNQLQGDLLSRTPQFTLTQVQVISATINLDEIRSYRTSIASRGFQACQTKSYPRIHLDLNLIQPNNWNLSQPIPIEYLSPEQEIQYGPALWLWDYLRRSKQSGFILPLSGGIDSCSTAMIVYTMCRLVTEASKDPSTLVLKDIRCIVGDDSYTPLDPKELCGRIFHTCYLGTQNSSTETRARALSLSNHIGSYHIELEMDDTVSSIVNLFQFVTNKTPRFKVHGGTSTENIALQNIQARLRMVITYVFAQLLPWVRGRESSSLLVLSSANVDETLRGYFTKYDCSSGDLNPIGGISKTDLRKFIHFLKEEYQMEEILESFLNAVPTAELEPITNNYIQKDEVDMGMTYEELSVFGTLRKIYHCGPFSMFKRLVSKWSPLSPKEIGDKVKKFFFYYAINRHKTTILPPSYHMSMYSPDDNRFDLRPFLYNVDWTWQFKEIDDATRNINNKI